MNKKLIGIGIAIGLSLLVFGMLMFYSYILTSKKDNMSETTIIPGPYPQGHSCAIGNVPFTGSIINSNGFDVYKITGITDYVILPGTEGNITYELIRGTPTLDSNNSALSIIKVTNITNSAIFIHQGTSSGTESIPIGVTISFLPQSESLKFNDTSYITAIFHVSNNATKGTYWFSFNPGPCHGPQFSFFTIGDHPYDPSVLIH